MSNYFYNNGAIHNDHHKEMTVNVSGKADMAALMNTFWAVDVEEVEEIEEVENIKDESELDVPENCEQEIPPVEFPFTEVQMKASGIKTHPDVVLALMKKMQPQCTQQVDWLSFYTVLFRRQWVEKNLSAFCRMVNELFGVKLDNHSLSKDLSKNSIDYTFWTSGDQRILRRKRLAEEFDQCLTDYFKHGREEVMKGVRG